MIDSNADPAATARAIAFYLPQFHAIPENDAWWGAGFTEWTNVRRARPLFVGHEQPRRPGELGYYDLLSSHTRAAQAELAAAHGIEAFCYWHYWFAGRRLLERPFRAVLRSKEPKFRFCLAWANHSWTAAWVGEPWRMLVEQTYPGKEDHVAHFEEVRPAFEDNRYVTVDGRPLFVIFRPQRMPEVRAFTDLWRELACRSGFPGLYLLGICDPSLEPGDMGLDGTIAPGIGHLLSFQYKGVLNRAEIRRRAATALERPALSAVHQCIARAGEPPFFQRSWDRVTRNLLLPMRHSYSSLVTAACQEPELAPRRFPTVTSNWDNTPRMGRWGTVLEQSSAEDYSRHLRHAVELVRSRAAEERLVFLKSWNEWAEGNYLEPDEHHGRALLEASRDALLVGAATRSHG